MSKLHAREIGRGPIQKNPPPASGLSRGVAGVASRLGAGSGRDEVGRLELTHVSVGRSAGLDASGRMRDVTTEAPPMPAAGLPALEDVTNRPSPREAETLGARAVSGAREAVPRGRRWAMRLGWRGWPMPIEVAASAKLIRAYERGLELRRVAERARLWRPGCGVDVGPAERARVRDVLAELSPGPVAGRRHRVARRAAPAAVLPPSAAPAAPPAVLGASCAVLESAAA